jgi:hypothetical protein
VRRELRPMRPACPAPLICPLPHDR